MTASPALPRAGSDGRTLALFLTQAGQQQRLKILLHRQQKLHLAIDCLSSTEKKQLTKLLEKMLTAMTTDSLRAYTLCRLCSEEVCPPDRCPVEQKYRQYFSTV